MKRLLAAALLSAVALLASSAVVLADSPPSGESNLIVIDGPPEFVQAMRAGLETLDQLGLKTYVETYVRRIDSNFPADAPPDAAMGTERPAYIGARVVVHVRWPSDGWSDPIQVPIVLAHEATHARLWQVHPAVASDETAPDSVGVLVCWMLVGNGADQACHQGAD
jgi:hypothetical protein